MLKTVYISGGMRTPWGAFNGSLNSLTAPQLGSLAIRATLQKTGVDPREVDEVLFGNVIGAGLGQNPARQASIGAGIGVEVGAVTVNKVCGSATRAVVMAAQSIQCGDTGLAVAGGCESMSNPPYLLMKARSGYRMGNGELVDALIHDGLWDVYTNKHMGACGDQCAKKYGFSRQDQDDFSIESYKRAQRAWDEGFFAGEVVPVEVKSGKTVSRLEIDEDLSKYQGEEKLRALRPAFGAESTITAGNASKINDGASAMLVYGEEKRKALGLKPEVKILGYANAAMEPDWFTIAPIYAIRKLCEQLKIKPTDVDFYEINEAFAVVALAAIRELKIEHAKVNAAGGAVAIGHPIGATGGRIVSTLIRTLIRNNKRLGIACLCIGGGEALAIALERC